MYRVLSEDRQEPPAGLLLYSSATRICALTYLQDLLAVVEALVVHYWLAQGPKVL